jgi:hypothetical protein
MLIPGREGYRLLSNYFSNRFWAIKYVLILLSTCVIIAQPFIFICKFVQITILLPQRINPTWEMVTSENKLIAGMDNTVHRHHVSFNKRKKRKILIKNYINKKIGITIRY